MSTAGDATGLLDFLTALKDAPVANLIVIVATLFGVAAVRGKLFSKLDRFGRGISLSLSSVLYSVGMVIALRMVPGPIQGRVILAPEMHESITIGDDVDVQAVHPTATALAHVTPLPSATSPETHEPHPTMTPQPPSREEGPDTYVSWGCEERASGEAVLVLHPGERLVSARIQLSEIDKAKSFGILEPKYDSANHRVVGGVEFVGLDRVFFNCPGGGHARFRIVAEVERSP